MALRKLVVVSQDLAAGYCPSPCVRNYCNCQSNRALNGFFAHCFAIINSNVYKEMMLALAFQDLAAALLVRLSRFSKYC